MKQEKIITVEEAVLKDVLVDNLSKKSDSTIL